MLPSTKTFGIPELLGMILDNARPQDVLLWQGVNKTWQAAFQRSPRIQEKLFIKAETCKDEDEEEQAVLNPFMNLFLFYNSFGTCSFSKNAFGEKATCSFSQNAFGGKASYPTASWRQMLISTPAITQLRLARVVHYGSVGRTYFWPIFCKSGITIGQLAKAHEEEGLKCYDDFEHGEPIWVSSVCIRYLKEKDCGAS